MTKRNTKLQRILLTLMTLIICVVLVGKPSTSLVDAMSLASEGPDRTATITISYTVNEWWLLTWQNSQVLCQIYVEHEGWPEASEVQHYCGTNITNRWLSTQPCMYSDEVSNPAECAGLYLHQVSITPSQRELEITLDPAEAFVSISECNPMPPENRCSTLPSLRLEAIEPLPNEVVISIQGFMDGEPFNCSGDTCDLPLPPTGTSGIPVEFWANSSFGDSSEVYTAQVRVIPWGGFASPEEASSDETKYFVDILSSQLQDSTASTCSQIWSSFVPVGGTPSWLSTPEYVQDLVSTKPYYFLAGSMIQNGLVDANNCENGGMEFDGVANQCGLEMARPLVNSWQNQFDGEILRISKETGVPAQLMKNIFSQESQFWPGIYDKVYEAGLGHLSDLGADTVLLWNPSFFSQFCPLVLETDTCQRGFGNLDITQQEMLRGALVQKVNAGCPDCPMGIDLSQANFSISIFARSLLANCEQVGQIVQNATQSKAGNVASYEDLWRFTLTNYNAGSGCLINAIQRTTALKQEVNWVNVSANLEEGCRGAIEYINSISLMPVYDPGVATEPLEDQSVSQTEDSFGN